MAVAIRCLSGQTSFSEEFVRTQNCNDGFLASLRNNRNLYLAFLDIENRIGGIFLGEDDLRFRVRMKCSGPRRPWREMISD